MERLDILLNRIKKFNDDRDWNKFHTADNLAKSISIEAGELLEHFQWGSKINIDEVGEEIADVMNYCLQLCQTLNLDPIEIINKKMDKNEIKYPIDLAYGSAKKYNELKKGKKNG